MLGLLAGSDDGKAIRKGWLEVLMKRFDAQLGASQNAAYDANTSGQCQTPPQPSAARLVHGVGYRRRVGFGR